jgi:hypothetical protein
VLNIESDTYSGKWSTPAADVTDLRPKYWELYWGLLLRIIGVWASVGGLGFRVSGFRVQVSGSGIRVPGLTLEFGVRGNGPHDAAPGLDAHHGGRH